jgi:amino acid transporter
MQALGEMATWLPVAGAVPQFCSRYVDGALGFAIGWNVSVLIYLGCRQLMRE